MFQSKNSWLIAILGILFPLVLSAQSETELDSMYLNAHDYLLEYQQRDTNHTFDSVFARNIEHLNWFAQNDSLHQQFKTISNIVNQNRANNNLTYLRQFYDSLLIKKHLYDSIRTSAIRIDTIADKLDTLGLSSSDSNFMDLIDHIMNIPEHSDSVIVTDSAQQILLEKYYYTDTLISAVGDLISYYQKDDFIEWINTVRRDTFDFYIIDIEGDSLLVQLYDANPNLIHFNITDYWGSKIQAVIRNVNSNSFRILVDDAPSIDYETSEKAIDAFGNLTQSKNGPSITLTKREIINHVNPWLIYGNTNLDFSQVGMYQWAQGGEPTLSFASGFEMFAKYKKDNHNWDSHLRLGFGVLRQGRYADTSENFRPYEDRIEFNTKYGLKLFKHYNLTVEGDFKSQFAPQNDWDGNTKGEMISKFMSPGYATLSLGLDLSKYSDFSLFLSPASSRTTFVLDTAVSIKKRYNVDTTSNYRSEFGFRLKAQHKINLWEDIELKNSLELYSNYLNKPKNVDVNWEMTIFFPVNDFIRATISTHLIYDDDQMVPKYRWEEVTDENGTGTDQWVKHESPGLQFKEAIKLGLVLRF